MVTEATKVMCEGSGALTVLYDGGCPLCRREIAVYRGLQPLRSDAPVCYVDISDTACPLPSALPPDTSREQLLKRFHVRGFDGELISGAQAFLALWGALPGWRWLSRIGRVPGATWLMERVYRLFLRWRPALQRWASSKSDIGVKQLDVTSRSTE
jgi:predicted DCC family thiol-disulfide oxidoreductase YuxK